MFDLFSWSHILILLVAALVIVGPKDLPRLMHMAGKWAGKARAMASEFRKSFDEMARQAELDELRKEIEDLKKNNPVSELTNELNALGESVNSQVNLEDAGQGAVETGAEPDIGPEPRSGELEITQARPADELKTAVPKTPTPAAAAEIEPPLP